MVSLVNCLLVAHMVEALLILLGQDNLAPPLWFKFEVRKFKLLVVIGYKLQEAINHQKMCHCKNKQ
jgi:hypothetical protein